jgi:hypothetical protein
VIEQIQKWRRMRCVVVRVQRRRMVIQSARARCNQGHKEIPIVSSSSVDPQNNQTRANSLAEACCANRLIQLFACTDL